MTYTGLIAGVSMLVLTGLGHIMVIKSEQISGTRLWTLYLIIGLACITISFFSNTFISIVLGITAATFLWGIKELFEQKKRVKHRKVAKHRSRN